MFTELTESPELAANRIRRGEVVAFPTETVYGLGADIFNEAAVASIFEAKGRPRDNPLIAHIHSLDQIALLSDNVPATARELIDRFFPGPLTVVLPKSKLVSNLVSAGLDTIGIRMPGHPVANAFLKASEVPVVAPSANLSGRPSPTTWQAVMDDLNGRIPCILKGEIAQFGIESTVVDCSSDPPIILRPGSIALEQIQAIAENTTVLEDRNPDVARSPGLRHRHYAPNARISIVQNPPELVPRSAAYLGVDSPERPADFEAILIVKDSSAYAHELFRFFRQCDAGGIEIIFCQRIPPIGVGKAVMDRLDRAAEAFG